MDFIRFLIKQTNSNIKEIDFGLFHLIRALCLCYAVVSFQSNALNKIHMLVTKKMSQCLYYGGIKN